MSDYTINSAGMAVPKDADEDEVCWVCGHGNTIDGLCFECTADVVCIDLTEPLDRWDAEAAKRGLPPIDRAKWDQFYFPSPLVEAQP